ncbi:unnamed protein product [Lupinus luteus]|uniref:Uncharacterized protein n=1 Tax=Lupinus luteus TaxID=3873 RepID=A0AAV1VRJ1_LUPLU
MPHYDDKYANTRLYVVLPVLKGVDPRDADDARYYLDGRDIDGRRIIMEFAKGVPRGSREYQDVNRVIHGHQSGHVLLFGVAAAATGRHFCFPTLSCIVLNHYSGCLRSPVKRAQSPIREDRSESPRYISPETKSNPPASSTRRHSPSPDDANPQKSHVTSPSNSRLATQQDGSDYSDDGRRERSGSPASPARDDEDRDYASPKNNGNKRSHSPRDDMSPNEDDNQPYSPTGSESP